MVSGNPCTGCGARCCRKFLVAVVPSDVEKLSAKLNRRVSEFLELFPARRCECLHAPSFWIGDEDCYLGIKRIDGRCMFLVGEECVIHDFKPLVCRTFPFCLDEKGEISKSGFCGKHHECATGKKGELRKYENELDAMRRDALEWNLCTAGFGGLGELAQFLRGKAKHRREVGKAVAKIKSK